MQGHHYDAPDPHGNIPNPHPEDGRRRVLSPEERRWRNLLIARLVNAKKLPVGAAAAVFHLSVRSIYRIVEQGRIDAGGPQPPVIAPPFKPTIRVQLYHMGVFIRVTDPDDLHWRLSPTAPGYPLTINGIEFPDCEGLFQALRMSVQREEGFREGRWRRRRVDAMMYVLAAKLVQHPVSFSQALTGTGGLSIVAADHPDPYWGTRPEGHSHRGCNVLGRLLSRLRDELHRYNGDVGWAVHAFLEQTSLDDLVIDGLPVPPDASPAPRRLGFQGVNDPENAGQ